MNLCEGFVNISFLSLQSAENFDIIRTVKVVLSTFGYNALLFHVCTI